MLTRTLLDLFVLPPAMDLFISTSRHSNMLTFVHSLQSNYDPCLVLSPYCLPLILVPRRINVCVLISSISSVPHQHNTHTLLEVCDLFVCPHHIYYAVYCVMCSLIIVCHYIITSVFQKLKENKNMQKWKKKKEFKSCKRLSQIVQRQSFLLQIWENFKYFYWLVWCSVHVCHSNFILPLKLNGRIKFFH